MDKRGDLSLSISAIVIIVIAFVVLGLGLSLTRTIFKGAEQKLPEAFAVTQLEAEPTSENPITIQQTVEADRGKGKTMTIGFYNRAEGTAFGSTFTITSCLKKDRTVVEEDKIPTIASISQSVGPSSAAGFSLVMTENELPADTYICTIAVICDATQAAADGGQCPADNKPYETKQFFLKVVA